MILSSDIDLARRWAENYRLKGYNPLPSAMASPEGRKKPLCAYACYWEEPAPAGLFLRFPTSNIQLVTGRRWQLLVIDLDGPEAIEQWDRLGRCPWTWITHSGGNGRHIWFRLPEGLSRPLPSVTLWKGVGPHSAIERLCDQKLVMVPPSIHPRTGKRYRFLSRAHSPSGVTRPAMCPDWVLALQPVEPERTVEPFRSRVSLPLTDVRLRYRVDDVLDAILDKPNLAATWGLRLASRPCRSAGWVSCHALDRPDNNPSARISIETGRYWEPGDGAIGLFDLAVRLGAYGSWTEAVNDLGDQLRVAAVRSS
jgi:hypothetical protein